MHEVPQYLMSLAGTLIGGGAVWGAIRTEIKYLWKSVNKLEKQVEELSKKAA